MLKLFSFFGSDCSLRSCVLRVYARTRVKRSSVTSGRIWEAKTVLMWKYF